MSPEQAASEQICQRFIDCDCSGIDESYEECVAAGVGELLELHEDAAALGLSFDPACLEARMARFAKLGCATDWSETGPYILCYLHVGTRERGESCVWYPEIDASDCRPGLGCHGGVCDDPMPEYVAGEACYLSWPVCVGDARCLDLDNDDNHVCEAMAHAGDPCLGGFYCVESVCDADTSTCLPLRELGESCGTPLEVCALGLECAKDGPMAGTCQERPPLPGAGEGCTPSGQCAEGLECEMYSNTCQSPPPYVCRYGATELVPVH